MKLKPVTYNRRQCLKWLGIGAVSAVGASVFTPILHQKSLRGKAIVAEHTESKSLEQLLLDTGEKFLPKDLYHATQHAINQNVG